MIKNDYNGWTNKQTWNVNLTYGELFQNMCEEQTFDDIDHMAGSFEEMVSEVEADRTDEVDPCSLMAAAFNDYMAQVNWTEIAEHYAQDFPECIAQEDEEVEA